jgi:hypothetical protein
MYTFLKNGLMPDLYSIQHIYMIDGTMRYLARTAEKSLLISSCLFCMIQNIFVRKNQIFEYTLPMFNVSTLPKIQE